MVTLITVVSSPVVGTGVDVDDVMLDVVVGEEVGIAPTRHADGFFSCGSEHSLHNLPCLRCVSHSVMLQHTQAIVHVSFILKLDN